MVDYIAFTFCILLFLGPPVYLWIKWIRAAFINRNTISKIASISSFTLFILGWSISWFGPEDSFEHNTITLTLTGFFSILAHFLALSITLAYFVSKWIYQAILNIRS